MKTKILITGASSSLGHHLIKILGEKFPLILCARQPKNKTSENIEWIKFDMENPPPIEMGGVKKIIHLASSVDKKSFKIDVEGTRNILEQARRNDVEHFIFISIVGVDTLPIKYFRIKKQVEQIIIQSGIPFTILRSTQFFPFFEKEINKYFRFPIAFLPSDILYQPIDISIVAKKLAKISLAEPVNDILEIGGAEILDLGEAARIWRNTKSLSKPIVELPLSLLGKFGKKLKNGALTTNESSQESLTWNEWIKKR